MAQAKPRRGFVVTALRCRKQASSFALGAETLHSGVPRSCPGSYSPPGGSGRGMRERTGMGRQETSNGFVSVYPSHKKQLLPSALGQGTVLLLRM